MKHRMRALLLGSALLVSAAPATRPSAMEDGYDLWLRYRPIADPALTRRYAALVSDIIIAGDSPTMDAVRAELQRGLGGMLGAVPSMRRSVAPQTPLRDGAVIIGTPGMLASMSGVGAIATAPALREALRAAGDEGYVIRPLRLHGKRVIVITGNRDVGALYGTFRFLRELQLRMPSETIAALSASSAPRIKLRLLNHWDNLDRSVERGYAGRSLWDWNTLPDSLPARYRDYARANASIGINGAVLTNVNANATVLTPHHLRKVAALAGVFRPYGIRVYLTARFSAPIEIGDLKTADPLDPAVRAWWKSTVDSVYHIIPDFGGFVVKANSEGQPGPQDYHRSHADGANMLAEAVVPHGGVVMWRAFVYSSDVPVDRIKQSYDEFKPLDGQFRDGVFVQVKNGPLDFQPREPFHPLFGAMPKTPLTMEFQITKEYLGQDTHLVYLGGLFAETLRADTYAHGAGSTIARVVDGSLERHERSAIAGVANIGDDRNWTGSHFNQANWYAFGRIAWDPSASPAGIADEWIRSTLTTDTSAVRRIRAMMLTSRDAVVNYMTPLGLAHIMATGHHYGPGPWVNDLRPDWTPVYYHRADTIGIGFDRTPSGSNAVAQYAAPVRARLSSRATVGDSLLLFFHRVRWTDRVVSGRTVWNELAHRYQTGVDSVAAMRRDWEQVRSSIDAERFADVRAMLTIQEREAIWWRDAALQYFQTFSRQPLPAGYPAPAHPLEFYQRLRCPPNRDKPRCSAIE